MLFVIFLSFVSAGADNVTVTDVLASRFTCFHTYEINKISSVTLRYSFDDTYVGACWFRFDSRGYKQDMCIDVEKFTTPGRCNVIVKYREWDRDNIPAVVHNCRTYMQGDNKHWCTKDSVVFVHFDKIDKQRTDPRSYDIKLNIYRPDEKSSEGYIAKNKYKIIGVFAGVLGMLLVAGIVAVVCCRTNTRRRRRRSNYQSSSDSHSVNAELNQTHLSDRTTQLDSGSYIQPSAPPRCDVFDEPPPYSDIVKESIDEPPPPYPGKWQETSMHT